MRSHLTSALFAAGALAACVEPPLSPAADLDAAPAAAIDDDPDHRAHMATTEGEVGRVRVRTRDGAEWLTYVYEHGNAIHEGDIDLGPVRELHARGGAAVLGERWSNGVFRYTFDPEFTGDVCGADQVDCEVARKRVKRIYDLLDEQLPVSFVEIPWDTRSGNYVTIRYGGDDEDTYPGRSSHTGMEGGEQFLTFRSGHLGDSTSEDVVYHLQPRVDTLRHETLHALGLWHEQNRRDRDEFVDIFYDCIDGGSMNGNYEKKDNSADLGPYDYASIMHYQPNAMCRKVGSPPACACATITPKWGPFTTINDGHKPDDLSIEDVNMVYRMYAHDPGVNDTGDNFGAAMAAADFDGDGYTDLAVGIPLEDLVDADAGMVAIFRGTSKGLVAWHTLTEESFGGQVSGLSERFGASLVAFNLDGDGHPDLAIGAPGESGNIGAVFVFRGAGLAGFEAHRVLSQDLTAAGIGEPGDRFGEALAAGRIANKTVRIDDEHTLRFDTLVVGAPGDRAAAVVGVPVQRPGGVYLFQESRLDETSPLVLHKPTRLDHPGLTGHDFGAALAVGRLDGDSNADLAVGAPGGALVKVFKGVTPPEPNPFVWSAMATYQATVTGTAPDRFGAAVAIGPIWGRTGLLAVGAPGYSTNRGRVRLYVNGLAPTIWTTLGDDVVEAGDEFGAALLAFKMSTQGESGENWSLIVGAPGEDDHRGRVTAVHDLISSQKQFFTEAGAPFQTREVGDRFGAALAAGNFDGRGAIDHIYVNATPAPDLVIGAPSEGPDYLLAEDPRAGAIFEVADSSPSRRMLHQEGSGREP